MNTNQYGFTPQRCTIDAAMAVKDFVEGLVVGEIKSVNKSIVKAPLMLLGGLAS
jgi:hypothetical protein